MARESLAEAELRWQKLELLQKHFVTFDIFLEDVMENLMGFKCTDIQQDIGRYIVYGPKLGMVQAQRGQAKTTVAAAAAVFDLIHNPQHRILIVSAGGKMAKQISNWIIQIINGMDVLECMRPDMANGDRSSIEEFDIHYSLKGAEKSPSVGCLGINANLQGWRADLLIPDDIESKKNSATEEQRAKLRDLTKDFTSICSNGKIMYLGTPQSIDSIYNSLPSRGYSVRIWPGRYPTLKEQKNYGNALAPLLLERMAADPSLRSGGGPTGERGKPIDPVILDEEALTFKEIDQGAAYFQLQHMLDTRLMDAARFPLKPQYLVFMDIPNGRVPIQLNWVAAPENRILPPQDFPVQDEYYKITGYVNEWAEFTGCHIYIDPSGGGKNGDELAWAVTKFQSGTVYLVDVGGIPGGLSTENQEFIADLAAKWKPQQIDIEDNFGAGTFRQVLTPVILKKHKCAIEGVYEHGQKELRIIETLEPIISSQRLVVDSSLLLRDWEQCQKYSVELRSTYSFFFQLSRLTRDRKCLLHDDRLDAVAGSCRHWTDLLAIDKAKEIAKSKQAEYNKMMNDPLGNGRPVFGNRFKQHNTIFDRFRRQ